MKEGEVSNTTHGEAGEGQVESFSSGRSQRPRPILHRLLAALFYGASSFAITIMNKSILTTYGFSSFQVLGLGQMLATMLVLLCGLGAGLVALPSPSWEVLRKVWPLPVFYVGNMVFGLGGIRDLSLPMFTVLRRLSVLMIMVLEYYVLGNRWGVFVRTLY